MALKFPQYISTTERTISVIGIIDKEKFEKEENKELYITNSFVPGKGYIAEDDSIWIFCEAKPKNNNAYPYFWYDAENETLVYSDPPEIIRNAYSVDNLKDISLVNIIERTKENEVLFNEEEINDLNAAAAFYVPVISEQDDFLKRIVKYTIIEKGVDINKLKSKTDEKYILPNMKAALQNKTKMSVIYFLCWMNLLGCDFEINIFDNGTDKRDELKNPIIYQSYNDNIGKLVNNEIQPIIIPVFEDLEDEE